MVSPTDPHNLIDPCIPVEGVIATASRPYRDGNGKFLKHSPHGNSERVRREATFILAAAVEGAGPRLYGYGADWIVMEDLGTGDPIEDIDALHAGAARLLGGLAAANIRHNDLGLGNVIMRRGNLYAVDFGRSQWLTEPRLPGYIADGRALARAVVQMTVAAGYFPAEEILDAST